MSRHAPAPTWPDDRQMARPRRRSSAALNGTSLKRSTGRSPRRPPPWRRLDGHRSVGKVERFNRSLRTEWAYATAWTTNDDRTTLLPTWLNPYDLNRPHLGIGGRSPIDRVNNAAGQCSE